MEIDKLKDLIVIGGGINGAGIAADAAGRGLSVLMLEANDLGCATSSASSKLIHGGLRYLENYEFSLVRDALAEREILLKSAPHIIIPMRFRMPHCPYLRPAWIIRIGLFIYDHLKQRVTLPSSKSIRFSEEDSILKSTFLRGFEYSDCWVDDARLVVLNAQEVLKQGSEIRTRCRVIEARRQNALWHVTGKNIDNGQLITWISKGLVNATGPWVNIVFDEVLHLHSIYKLRLIKGSHIILPKIHSQKYAYILQNEDHRVVFVLPWMEHFSLIGTTEVEYNDDPHKVRISDEEVMYLLEICNKFFKKQFVKQDIIWSYSGVRPLYDDKSNLPQTITRQYTLDINDMNGSTPLLSVFGGKLTTYRKLAEESLNMLSQYYPSARPPWTTKNILPGGDFIGTIENYAEDLYNRYNFIDKSLAHRYAYTYGSNSELILKAKNKLSDLGEYFGHNLYEAELQYLVDKEWVYEVQDVIWRRTKLALWLNKKEIRRISEWLTTNRKNTSFIRL
ncbi:MAG: glycerol-3-phosphate dehydrogenase [Candidatus Dasytiphilus stammeri]